MPREQWKHAVRKEIISNGLTEEEARKLSGAAKFPSDEVCLLNYR